MDTLLTHICKSDPVTISAWATVIYAGVSILLFIITCLNFWFTQKVFKLTKRPIVAIDSFVPHFTDENITENPSHISFEVKNVGGLPAKKVSITLECKFLDSKINAVFPESGQLAVFPKITHSYRRNIDKLNIEDLQFIKSVFNFQDSLPPIQIILDVKYYSITGKKYTTNYIYHYNPKTKLRSLVNCDWT
jgi:hypothetical protein